MPVYIGLLRGINVGGQRPLRMNELQTHTESCGATDVRTYIQSGNLVFQHGGSAAMVRKSLEECLAKGLGGPVSVLVKSVQEFVAIAGANPYDSTLPDLGKKMYVCFFDKPPGAAAIESIRPYVTAGERLSVKGSAAYAYYADGVGRAKLSSALIERKLGLATLRNWNTVTALLEMATESQKGKK